MTKNDHHIKIAIVAYPDVQMAAVLGLNDLFSIANTYSLEEGGPVFEVTVLDQAMLENKNNEIFKAIIMPPNLSGARGQDDVVIHRWLFDQHETGAIVCSICAGVFWLAYGGLLENRSVTTHWMLAEELESLFAKVQVNSQHLLIDNDDIVTAGGMMAWLDLGLFIVKKWLGNYAMTQTARHLLVDPSGREQKNYKSFKPPFNHGDSAVLKTQKWLQQNIAHELNVKDMADQANLSERTFLRRFKKATKQTPNVYLQHLRIEMARALLEQTQLPVNEIGWRTGYQDASAFSRTFKVILGLSASEYRKRFSTLG